MCELFAMCARLPTTIEISFTELARHGGGTGPHRDGWGVALWDDGDALVIRDPEAAYESPWIQFLGERQRRAQIAIAHVRMATQGPRALRNTQPFAREVSGRVHLFAHNGVLPGIEHDVRFAASRFHRIGDTDSEHAFCALLERVASIWERGVPSLSARLDLLSRYAADLRSVGSANFIYTDGDAVFAHGHRRKQAGSSESVPGLYVLCRTCAATADAPLAGVSIAAAERQLVALAASVPLSDEAWQPLAEGEVVVLRDGQVVGRTHGHDRRAEAGREDTTPRGGLAEPAAQTAATAVV